jgi:hypothetical protein
MADVFEPEQMADLVERCAALHLGREHAAAVIMECKRDARVADLGADILTPRFSDAGSGSASTHSTTTSASDADATRANRTGTPVVDQRRKPAQVDSRSSGFQPGVPREAAMNTRIGRRACRSHLARTGVATIVTSATAATGVAGCAPAVAPNSAAPK